MVEVGGCCPNWLAIVGTAKEERSFWKRTDNLQRCQTYVFDDDNKKKNKNNNDMYKRVTFLCRGLSVESQRDQEINFGRAVVTVVQVLPLSLMRIYSIIRSQHFIGAFAKFRKATVRFVMSFHLSACPFVHPHGTTRHPPYGFPWRFMLRAFNESVQKRMLCYKCADSRHFRRWVMW